MKTTIFAGIAVLAATAAFAQSGGQMAVPAGPDKQVYDIPAGSKDQQILIQTRSLQDGESVTPHIHNGVEMTEVVQGTFELYVKGQPVKVIHAGESFMVPREAPHDARPAPGTGPVKLAVHTAGDSGKLFGSITAADVVAAIKKAGGPNLDKRTVQLPKAHIKSVGTHPVTVRLHPDVNVSVSLSVEAE